MIPVPTIMAGPYAKELIEILQPFAAPTARSGRCVSKSLRPNNRVSMTPDVAS